MSLEKCSLRIIRWIARLLAVLVLLFWVGFFVDHLQQWFIKPLPQTPPPYVWFGQVLHLLILAGLIIGFKWERLGGVVVIVAGVLFLIDKTPVFIPLTILPGVLYLYCWWKSRYRQERASAAAL